MTQGKLENEVSSLKIPPHTYPIDSPVRGAESVRLWKCQNHDISPSPKVSESESVIVWKFQNCLKSETVRNVQNQIVSQISQILKVSEIVKIWKCQNSGMTQYIFKILIHIVFLAISLRKTQPIQRKHFPKLLDKSISGVK